MYAVIETGGKQYCVKPGDQLKIEKLDIKAGEKVTFDKVFAAGAGADVQIGTPYVEAAKVVANVVESGKDNKVIIFKYKAKKDYRKKQGHRQPYTVVEIESISANGIEAKAEPKPEKEEETESSEKVSDVVEEEKPKETKKHSLKSMRKAELIAFAKENDIELDETATNQVMIETIEVALK